MRRVWKYPVDALDGEGKTHSAAMHRMRVAVA